MIAAVIGVLGTLAGALFGFWGAMKTARSQLFYASASNLKHSFLEVLVFSSEPNERSHYEYEYNKNVFLVSVVDIFPKIRGQNVPIFNDGESDGEFKTARERTVSILKAIQIGVPLPPVKVVNLNGDKKYKFKLATHAPSGALFHKVT